MADAMKAMTDVMNEVQSRLNGEDIKVKLRNKATNGGTVGRAKLGYLNIRETFEGREFRTAAVDPERARP
jgi:site-specific DNA recombinase